MPKEGNQQPHREHGPERESETRFYHRSARFDAERPAWQAYQAAQEALFAEEAVELSAYRLMLDRDWYVTVLGDPPDEEFDHKLQEILSAGVEAQLPSEVLQSLVERRIEAGRAGPWVERHFRPGSP